PVVWLSYSRYTSPRLTLFSTDTATTTSYTLSLHDALPILPGIHRHRRVLQRRRAPAAVGQAEGVHHLRPASGQVPAGARRRVRHRGDRLRARRRQLHGDDDWKCLRLISSLVKVTLAVWCSETLVHYST